jgi:hypothetical protein
MTLPANIVTEATSLQAQVEQYTPLVNAPHAAIVAMQLNAAQLVADTQAALVAPSNLDNYTFPTDAPSMVVSVLSVLSTAETQNSLSLARGVFGRSASNLDQF